MTATVQQRQVFLHGATGQRMVREVLGGQLVALILNPEPLWLLSPWLSNFPVLDNRAGNWDSIEPAWGNRNINFIELLACAINSGVVFSLVTRNDPCNREFVDLLRKRLHSKAIFRCVWHNQLHSKALLSRHFFIKGSMNYTWSGTNRNDEYLELNRDPHMISEALEAYKSQYDFSEQQEVM